MLSVVLSLLATTATAHYVFPTTTVNGVTSRQWQYIRQTEHGGLTDLTSEFAKIDAAEAACGQNSVKGAPDVLSLNAGSQVTFNSNADMGHPGPLMWFMARVPDGQDIKTWDPAGKQVWFKISQTGQKPGAAYPDFTTGGMVQSTTIPKGVPNGNYLLRFEQIALHSQAGPQPYVACAQVKVVNGGTGRPGPLAAFPGQYKTSDTSVYLNIYNAKGPYVYPAPSVWSGN
ncbi:putative glycosyl hydrolase family 61 protein 10 [Elsinoe fawcettii]|nr:putative glycosyl hydrolase family 61 protein 10 [Elsinoe fawcettii]